MVCEICLDKFGDYLQVEVGHYGQIKGMNYIFLPSPLIMALESMIFSVCYYMPVTGELEINLFCDMPFSVQ